MPKRDTPSAAGVPLLRNISDTARLTAFYRARESERPDALFRDPFAARLADERGRAIANATDALERHAWPFTTRTCLLDRLIAQEIARGADLVVNLAAGLDTRPYRMELPSGLQWIEADLPGILDYKEEVLAVEQARCRLERVRVDLTDAAARRGLFDHLGRRARRVIVVCEGLLIYFPPAIAAALAEDLAAVPSFQRWIFDLASPGLLHMMRRRMGGTVEAAGAPFVFGPPEGPDFFRAHGWRPLEVHSMAATARRLGRLPWTLRLLAWGEQPFPGPRSRRPWSGVCLLEPMAK